MNKFYTGIGSRSTPPEIQALMTSLCTTLAITDRVLRSGAAPGADGACELGAKLGAGETEIYLPWPRFNGHASTYFTVAEEALNLAKATHPAWHLCSHEDKQLHGCSTYQVLGLDLAEPSAFVVCWTPDGCERESEWTRDTSGAGMAIALASQCDIPVFNLRNSGARERIVGWIAGRDVHV